MLNQSINQSINSLITEMSNVYFKLFVIGRYGCELWSLDDGNIKEFDTARRNAVRQLNTSSDTHDWLLFVD